MGAKVTLVDSLVPEYGGNRFNIQGIEDRVRVNISDVRRPLQLCGRIWTGQDFLFNLAGQTSHLDSMEDPFTDLEINCRAQLSILETCRQVNPRIRVVFASTRQIYGRPEQLPVDERHPLSPVDVNGINKLAGEFYHILYNDVYDLPAVLLRLTNTYGPRMRIKDARQTFVGVWIRRLLEDQPIEVWGGEQRRDFTYVDDCVDALLLAALHPEARGQGLQPGGNRSRQPGRIWRSSWSNSTAAATCASQGVPRRSQTDRHRRLLRRRFADSRHARLAAADYSAETGCGERSISSGPTWTTIADRMSDAPLLAAGQSRRFLRRAARGNRRRRRPRAGGRPLRFRRRGGRV